MDDEENETAEEVDDEEDKTEEKSADEEDKTGAKVADEVDETTSEVMDTKGKEDILADGARENGEACIGNPSSPLEIASMKRS